MCKGANAVQVGGTVVAGGGGVGGVGVRQA